MMRSLWTRLLTAFLTRSAQPFRFTAAALEPESWSSPGIGLYAHIPFCRTLCAFCPYNRVLYDEGSIKKYMSALAREVDLVGEKIGKRESASSLYLGGGSPALALDWLAPFLGAIDRRFRLEGGRAIELHPSDATTDTIVRLRDLRFDMVSLGAQSFLGDMHARIGRDFIDPAPGLGRLAAANFRVIDVDILFGLPGQTEELLEEDMRRAVELGATQVSTYPFISFSYAKTPRGLPGRGERRRLLAKLEATAEELGLERTSIWTFAKKGTAGYSSITRDGYLGFGASAVSLLGNIFKIDTFSVEAYIEAVEAGRVPTALTLRFNERTRALYWLFWNSYRMRIEASEYRRVLGRDLEVDFGRELRLGTMLGILKRTEGGFILTERGRYLFHLVEQAYTTEYIDTTWRTCRSEPWPSGLEL